MSEFVPQVAHALRGAKPRDDGSPEGVNLSQLAEWYRCSYRWHLKNRRLIDRRRFHVPMDRGSAVHAGVKGGIVQYANQDSPKLTKKRRHLIQVAASLGINKYAAEWAKDHGGAPTEEAAVEQFNEIMLQAEQHAWRALDELQLDRFEVLRLKKTPLAEHKLTIPFLPGIPFYGTPDVVWRDLTDRAKSIWVADWKVREQMQPVENELVDLQLPVYQYLLSQHGILTAGSMKFQIRAELPREPTLLASGKGLSRARIATTWDVYKATIEKHGFDVAEYEMEMRQKLDVPFFRLDRLYRNQFYINNVWQQVIVPLGKKWAKSRTNVRHMHFMNCNGCWAREFCLAELNGEDTSFLLETAYVDGHNPKAALIMRPEDFDFEEA